MTHLLGVVILMYSTEIYRSFRKLLVEVKSSIVAKSGGESLASTIWRRT
jgi:hypothetical protein